MEVPEQSAFPLDIDLSSTSLEIDLQKHTEEAQQSRTNRRVEEKEAQA